MKGEGETDVDQDREAEIFVSAHRMTGIDLDDLGADDEDEGPDRRGRTLRQATLLAGCLWDASIVMLDQLFDDVERLRADPGADIAETWILGQLPPQSSAHYTPLFAQELLVAAVDLTARLSRGWTPLACVAQELLLRVLLNQVEVQEHLYDVDLAPGWRSRLEEVLFEDLDHEMLFDPSMDGFDNMPELEPLRMAPMRVRDWFVPFNPERRLPPYAEATATDTSGS